MQLNRTGPHDSQLQMEAAPARTQLQLRVVQQGLGLPVPLPMVLLCLLVHRCSFGTVTGCSWSQLPSQYLPEKEEDEDVDEGIRELWLPKRYNSDIDCSIEKDFI